MDWVLLNLMIASLPGFAPTGQVSISGFYLLPTFSPYGALFITSRDRFFIVSIIEG